MIKKELIKRIAAANPHLRGSDAEKTVNIIFEAIAAALARGDRVEIRGVGAFTVRVRRGRSARNPKSGAEVVVSSFFGLCPRAYFLDRMQAF